MSHKTKSTSPKSAEDVTIVVGYPPIETDKGVPLLSQNRQFQYFNTPTYIYPMVPAYAASNLQDKGYKVYWMDGIAEQQTYQQWFDALSATNPDYLMVETKSPVVKAHWKLIDQLKETLPNTKLIWVGDHVTFMPMETMENSQVDYIITGGDYDFVSVNLLNHIHKGEELEGGVYWREGDTAIKAEPKITKQTEAGETVYASGPSALKHVIDELPFVDRDLTKW